jgi:5-methylcytosine-specific restriction protein A
MPQQFCAEPGCGVLVAGGRCAAHGSRSRVRLESPTYARAHRWYGSARWQRLRLEVLQAEPLCGRCRARGRTTPTVDVDHIVKHDGDADRFWNRRNLQGLCKACHSVKTASGQ